MEAKPLQVRSRRRFILLGVSAFALGIGAGAGGALVWARRSKRFLAHIRARQREYLTELSRRVLPPDGYQTSVRFGDSIQNLVRAGVIDPDKFNRHYAKRGGLPDWVQQHIQGSSDDPIVLSSETAPYLLNLLWPLGMANKTGFNDDSPINERVDSFASTGGWTLGKAQRGGGYFNRVRAVELSPAQEATVREAAEGSYRPCCNNSTFFQDCNHGSALLGLYELASSQGASTPELYQMGLAANSFWYAKQYLELAVFLSQINGESWENVAPATILGEQYSSANGWRQNVHAPLVDSGLVPSSIRQGGGSCSV